MRINLVTPFAEKDAAKALGARWDSANKQWYIVDVADLAPFLRWIPNVDAAKAGAVAEAASPGEQAQKKPTQQSAGVITTSAVAIAHCGCDVRAWEHCPHSATNA